jgi:Tol biopolymer transport system component/DNA-binding winged helix-turn-helix (wHTH) protein
MSGDFQIGDWVIQPAVNRLRCGSSEIRLEPKVMQVLVCLADAAGEVVPKEELIARVWPDVHVTDDVLHRAVRELRRALADSTATPRYIETIRKRGYRLLPTAMPVALDDPRRGDEARLGDEGRLGTAATFPMIATLVTLATAAFIGVLATRSTDLAPQAHARFVPVVSGPLNESDPAVSPDGRLIAFVQREAGNSGSADIYIRNSHDGIVGRITQDPASDRLPAWSPDGSELAFVRTTPTACDLMIYTVRLGTERRMAACTNLDEPRVVWTPDGRALVTSHATDERAQFNWRIARLDIATGAITTLTTPPAGIVGDHAPAISPNGQQIAFIRRVSGGVSDVYIAAIDGGEPRRLTFDESDLTGIDWSSDGRSIVFSSDRAGGYSLWRVAINGTAATLLAGGAARMKHPASDRAGRRVVYENWNYEINLWQAQQGAQQQYGEPVATPITRSSELWNIYPQVSPDGRRLAYVSTQSGSHQLWVADRNGAEARQLTRAEGGVVRSPRWSPDGRRIVFLARGRGSVDVHQIDLATGAVTALTTSSANEIAPAWSHDGARVVYGVADEQGRWAVWSVDATRPAAPRLEIANAVAAQASPDGHGWFYTRPDAPGIWRTPSDGVPNFCVLPDVGAANTLGWVIAPNAIYDIVERDDLIHVRRTPLGGGDPTHAAILTQFTWPGFSVAPDGAIVYARWDRRDSNLMSVEY